MVKRYGKLLILLGVLIIITAGVLVYFNLPKPESPVQAFELYKTNWEKMDFKAMYSMLAEEMKGEINEEQFIDRYRNIYEGIGVQKLTIKFDNASKFDGVREKTVNLPFSLTMDTSAGIISSDKYIASLIKEKVDKKYHWRILWKESLIFPKMAKGDKVKVETLYPKRGEICDRNGRPLAVNAPIITIGIHPKRFLKNKASNIAEMAKILDIKPEVILKRINSSRNPDFFTPVIKISGTENYRISKLLNIEGVVYQKSDGRVYPGGEAFGSLIGYIGTITAEELKKVDRGDYNEQSIIGKAGLEQVYEKRLRGINGKIIYISKQYNGKEAERITLARKEARDGDNIKLAIDYNLQKRIYQEMGLEAGACAAVNPANGEVLALVSSPSYDSNLLATYVTDSQRELWASTLKSPFENRFKRLYAPGSTFKLLTASIGLQEGKIDPEEKVVIAGDKWQPDKSWGNYRITRVKNPGKPENLVEAFTYSDNIYFARAALRIGSKAFIKGCSDFGIGEPLPFEYPIGKSQISNSGTIKSQIQLADSGYGQGQVLISPLQEALIYSSVVNQGNIMNPSLEVLKNNSSGKVWKQNLISKEDINILLSCLTSVIENPLGTGHAARTEGFPLAGKTGTAELKKNSADINAEEVGWFTCMNTENPKIAISMVIEDVKKRGGSHYVVPIVKRVLASYLSSNNK